MDQEQSREFLAANPSCFRCGHPASHVHHIRTKAAQPSLRYDTKNLAALCVICHDWVHHNPRLAREMFGA